MIENTAIKVKTLYFLKRSSNGFIHVLAIPIEPAAVPVDGHSHPFSLLVNKQVCTQYGYTIRSGTHGTRKRSRPNRKLRLSGITNYSQRSNRQFVLNGSIAVTSAEGKLRSEFVTSQPTALNVSVGVAAGWTLSGYDVGAWRTNAARGYYLTASIPDQTKGEEPCV